MANILDYVKNNKKTFDQMQFNEVDSLVLSAASYIKIPQSLLDELQNEKNIYNKTPKNINLEEYSYDNSDMDSVYKYSHFKFTFRDLLRSEDYEYMLDNVWSPDDMRELLIELASSPRFRNLVLTQYVSHTDENSQKQFAAISFLHSPIDKNNGKKIFLYTAFRGTDSTFVGWKEDFNMAFQLPVPAQIEAEVYLKNIYSIFSDCDLFIGGHSKGGNLAVYSASKLITDIPTSSKNIRSVYSHDGPGFISSFLLSDEFKNISPLIRKTVPQSSAIGMLLEDQENYTVVKSDGFGFWQHNFFKWKVKDCQFEISDKITKGAEIFDKSINSWLGSYSYEEREYFIDTIYSIFSNTDIKTVKELKGNLKENIPKITRKAKNLTEKEKEIIYSTITSLLKNGFTNLGK